MQIRSAYNFAEITEGLTGQSTRNLASESVQNGTNVYDERNRDQNHQWHHSREGLWAPTSQSSKLDLDHIDQSQHQEGAPGHRADTRDQHPNSEDRSVDVGEELNRWVVAGALGDSDGLLEAHCDKAGEQEAAEGVHVEGDEILPNGRARDAGAVRDKGVFGVSGVPGQADEDGQGEEGIHVHDAVEGVDVDAGGHFGSGEQSSDGVSWSEQLQLGFLGGTSYWRL